MKLHLGILLAMIFGSIYALYFDRTNMVLNLVIIMIALYLCGRLEEIEYGN